MSRRDFGNVSKLPSGQWRVKYVGPDGRRRGAPDTFRTKADATRWLARAEADMSRGTWRDPDLCTVTLRAYAEAWLSQRTVKGTALAPRTVQTYQHSLDAWILPLVGDLRLTDLTPAAVRTWHAQIRQSTGPTAVRQAYALLRAILNTAVADEAVTKNPCRITGAGQPSSPERQLRSLDDVEAMAAAMPVHLRTLVVVAFWGSLRLGEVIALQRRDVDLAAGTIQVARQRVEPGGGPIETEPKAASRRIIHLPSQAVDALTLWLADRPSLPTAPVFTRTDGRPLRAHHVDWAWRTARNKVGLSDFHFHDCRHASLTLAAQLGATTAEVTRRAGHSSTRAALIYQHAAESRDVEIAVLMSNVAPRKSTQSPRKDRLREISLLTCADTHRVTVLKTARTTRHPDASTAKLTGLPAGRFKEKTPARLGRPLHTV